MFQVHASWMRVATRTEPFEPDFRDRQVRTVQNAPVQRRPLRWLRQVLARKTAR